GPPGEGPAARDADALRRDQRPPEPGERVEGSVGDRPKSGLDELAPAAGLAHVVASGARGAVEHRPQPIGYPLDRLECRPPIAETLQLVGRQSAKGLPKRTGSRRPSRAGKGKLLRRGAAPRDSWCGQPLRPA